MSDSGEPFVAVSNLNMSPFAVFLAGAGGHQRFVERTRASGMQVTAPRWTTGICTDVFHLLRLIHETTAQTPVDLETHLGHLERLLTSFAQKGLIKEIHLGFNRPLPWEAPTMKGSSSFDATEYGLNPSPISEQEVANRALTAVHNGLSSETPFPHVTVERPPTLKGYFLPPWAKRSNAKSNREIVTATRARISEFQRPIVQLG